MKISSILAVFVVFLLPIQVFSIGTGKSSDSLVVSQNTVAHRPKSDSIKNSLTPKDLAINAINSLFGRSDKYDNGDSIIAAFDKLPAFGIYKDNYFIVGTNVTEKPTQYTSDAKFQVSIRHRITNSKLPFRTYLFLTYTQKALWDVFKNSFPFRDLNYNPTIGLGKALTYNKRFLGTVLFQFEHENSYFEFHDSSTTEARAEENISKTVDALFAVIVTMGVVPIIRCPKGDSAELVAMRLDAKLRDHLSAVGNLLESGGSYNRPVLLLVDRNIDLSVMISHAWSYQALIHDLLAYKLNRVKIEVDASELKPEEASSSSTKHNTVVKAFNLESSEPFWAEHAALPFTTVVANIQAGVTEVGQKKQHHQARSSAEASSISVLLRMPVVGCAGSHCTAVTTGRDGAFAGTRERIAPGSPYQPAIFPNVNSPFA
ncbi:MAG: hypothetical protein BGN96_09730 [Bacteroidales bacterium 45-6]|nr:MAG: hypothetical protein BGN96_09730 [Bacteroidales bacterium 45-6]